MTLALQSPEHVSDLVAVDNAPVDAVLRTAFAQYVKGMKEIEGAGVTGLREADAILAKYEEASPGTPQPTTLGTILMRLLPPAAVPPNPAIPPRKPLPAPGLQDASVPHPARDAGQGPRQHGRLPLQEPRRGPVREADAVRQGHQERVRARRGHPRHRALLPALPACGRRGGALAYIGEPGGVPERYVVTLAPRAHCFGFKC